MANIFVSYRRQDIPYVAVALKERLERRFGENSVFLDIDSIPFGADFRTHIDSAVGQCHCMLVLIGDKWRARNDRTGKNRLFDPRDYVRVEIEAALRRGIPVVPVLVEDAEMPPPEELPESIQDLGYRNAAEVRAGRDFHPHMTRLVDGLWEVLESKPSVVETPAKTVPEEEKPRRPVEQPKKRPQPAEPATTSPEPTSHGHPVLDIATIRSSFSNTAYAYTAGAIPAPKLENARAAYAPNVTTGDVLLLYDGSLFGGAEDGFLITKSAIYWRNQGDKPERLDFRDFKTVESNLENDVVTVNGRPIEVANEDSVAALARLLKGLLRVT